LAADQIPQAIDEVDRRPCRPADVGLQPNILWFWRQFRIMTFFGNLIVLRKAASCDLRIDGAFENLQIFIGIAELPQSHP
jgi:hypothetical protein